MLQENNHEGMKGKCRAVLLLDQMVQTSQPSHRRRTPKYDHRLQRKCLQQSVKSGLVRRYFVC